jgi:hypothetical protein
MQAGQLHNVAGFYTLDHFMPHGIANYHKVKTGGCYERTILVLNESLEVELCFLDRNDAYRTTILLQEQLVLRMNGG